MEARSAEGREEGGSIRREFQFPGDLWLPRRENRCRQPANNHTSYHYHTPGVYTNARHRILRSLSLLEGPRGERDWRVDARPNTFLRPAHPPVYLIINRLRLWPGWGEGKSSEISTESLARFLSRGGGGGGFGMACD